MTAPLKTSADLAALFGCDKRTIREKAKALGLGVALGGRAGYRYSEADVAVLMDKLRPAVEEKKKRPRRRVA